MADLRQQIPDEVVKPGSTAAAATDPALVVALSPNSPLPTGANTIGIVTLGADPDTIVSGTITAADAVVAAPAGNGAFLSGASTAGSYVSLLCPGGDSAWSIQVTGTFGGTTVYWEESLDSTTGVDGNWIAVNGRQTGVVNTVLGNGTTVAGHFRGNTSGVKYLRARAVGGSAISLAIILRMSAGTGAVFMNASIPAGGNVIGKTGIDQTTPGTTNLVALSPETTKIIGTVGQQAITKGTQGANGVTTQDLKDAGRSLRSITLDSFAVAATTETLNTVSISADMATPTTGTQYTVTAGKRFRLQNITASVHTITGNTVMVNVIVRIRAIVSGSLLVTSPLQAIIAIPGVAAANSAGQPAVLDFPDGMEFPAGAGFGITTTCPGFVATTAAPKVDITMIGYEY